MDEASTYIIFMGATFKVTAYFDVTDYGSKPVIDHVNGGDPGWGPEWNVVAMILREDRNYQTDGAEDLGPSFDATGLLLETLCQKEKIQNAILDAIADKEMNRHCARLRRSA